MNAVDGAVSGSGIQSPSDAAVCAATDLRVLFVIDSRFPGLGGAESQALKLAQALRDRGAFVQFVSPLVVSTHSDNDVIDGFPIDRIHYPHIRLLGSIVMMMRFATYLVRNRKNYDCMHIHVTRLLSATAGAVRPFTGFRVVTKISGFFEFEGGVLDVQKRFNPVNSLMRIAMKNIDHVQTISRQTREKLLQAGFRQEQITLIPNGIDTSVCPPPLPARERFKVGYCGRLREVKGVHVLIDAFAALAEARPGADIELVLAGSGETEPALRQQAGELGILDNITFLGLIEDTESFYADIDVYVQPSFAEGLPNSVMEAMHAARPVLASDIGGNNDLIENGESGFLFKAGDAAELGVLLIRSLDDPDARQSIGNAGRSVIETEFGMDAVIDSLVEVYRGR